MLEFQKKKKIKKVLYSRTVLIFLAIIFIILLRSLYGVYKKESLSMQNLDMDKNELAQISERQKDIANSLEYLKTDQGVESEIRNKFRVVKEGEKVAVIIDDQTSSTPATVAGDTGTTTEHGFWYNIFH